MPWEKKFCVDTALEKAGETFWANGYEATSMRDLLAAMGIQKGSFYDTYGSKREVYLDALRQYADRRFAHFAELIADQPPKKALRTLIEAVRDECISPEGHKGCMVINCALELAHTDTTAQRAVQQTFETHEQAYADLIRKGQQAGDIDAKLDPVATAKGMLAIVIGMRVVSRSGASKATLTTLAEQALALVDR